MKTYTPVCSHCLSDVTMVIDGLCLSCTAENRMPYPPNVPLPLPPIGQSREIFPPAEAS
jgi:hypothetical protein